MKKSILTIGLLFHFLAINAQDYFPLIPGSYWIYDVYIEGVHLYQDSVIYNQSIEINDTLFHLYINYNVENDLITMIDTSYLYDNTVDNNAIMLSNRNTPVVDSAIYAKHNFTDGDYWVYKKSTGNDTVYVEYIDNYSVSAGNYSDCFIQGEDYYFAPNVGIIKIKLWNDASYYELKRFFIPVETSIEIKEQEGLKFYPNPANDYITLKGFEFGVYQIYTLKGDVVKIGNVTDDKINIADLNKGFYMLKVKSEELEECVRFIKD